MQIMKRFWTEEDGMGVVEVILIMVVLIGMVVIFRDEIKTLVTNIWTSINKNAKKIYS
ncbi:MAG: Flp1 family type IVb pilin [Wujia sp.]